MSGAPGRKIEFEGSQGHTLAARLDMPSGTPRAFAVFAHCFTCGKDIPAATRIAEALARLGIAVLRFDFTGLGSSEGEFANTNFSSNVEDLLCAANWLGQHYQPPALLIGHSLGGAAVLAAASKLPDLVGVVTIAAPAEPTNIERLIAPQRAELEAKGEAEIMVAGRPIKIRKQFLDDIRSHTLRDQIAAIKCPLLVMHGPKDDVVGIENAQAIFDAAVHPKSFISLAEADHLIKRRQDTDYVAAVLSAWATRYLPEDTQRPRENESGVVTVGESGLGKFHQDVLAGRHRLVADEPLSIGGDDAGPGPYEYVLAGLGACTSMTLRMYAEHKNLPLERVSVTLTHEKIHAKDCAECEQREGKLDHIHRTIEIVGDLTDDQRARMLQIADRCPVHRTLESEVRITTAAAEE